MNEEILYILVAAGMCFGLGYIFGFIHGWGLKRESKLK
jgi:uncharacterized membrane protein (Fun14 family)